MNKTKDVINLSSSQLLQKGKSIFSKMSKQQYNQCDQADQLMHEISESLKEMDQNEVNECPAIFDFINAFSQIISLGLNKKESPASLILTFRQTVPNFPLSQVVDDCQFQTTLDLTLQPEAKSYQFFQLLVRYLLVNKYTSSFIELISQQELVGTFYEENSGVFLNQELKSQFQQKLQAYEDKERVFNFVPDLRFFKQLTAEQTQQYNKVDEICKAFPKETYPFRQDAIDLQDIMMHIFDDLETLDIVELLMDFDQKLADLSAGKSCINPFFSKYINYQPSQQVYEDLRQHIFNYMQAMVDCGAKLNKINFQIRLTKEMSFGEIQYKVLFIRFFISNPILLSFLLAHMASLFDQQKPIGLTMCQKLFRNEMMRNPIFTTKLAVTVFVNLCQKNFKNINYLGCYYQQIFSEMCKMMLQSDIGQVLLDSMVETLTTSYLEKKKKQENTELLVFFFISLILEIKSFQVGKIFAWFKKAKIPDTQEIIQKIDETTSEDEINYQLLYALLSAKKLSLLFSDSRLMGFISRFESKVVVDPNYLISTFIQKQRLLFMQVLMQSYVDTMNEVDKQMTAETEPKKLVEFIFTLNQKLQDQCKILTQDKSYITELKQIHGDQVDYMVDNIKIITAITQIDIPPMVVQIVEQLKQEVENKKISESFLQKWPMVIQMVEQTGLIQTTFLDVVNKTMHSQQQKQVDKKAKLQNFLNLHHLLEQCHQFHDPIDILECFNYGLIVHNALGELWNFVQQFNMEIRKFYSVDAWICNQQVIKMMQEAIGNANFTQFEFEGQKVLHSSKAANIVYIGEHIEPLSSSVIKSSKKLFGSILGQKERTSSMNLSQVHETKELELKNDEPIIDQQVQPDLEVEKPEKANIFGKLGFGKKKEPKLENPDVLSPLKESQPELKEDSVPEIIPEPDIPKEESVEQQHDLGDFFTTGNVKEEIKEASDDMELMKKEIERKQRLEDEKRQQQEAAKKAKELEEQKAKQQLELEEQKRKQEEKMKKEAEEKELLQKQQQKLQEEKEKAERERIEAQRLEEERIQLQKAEEARLKKEREEEEQRLQQLEKERLEKEKAQKEAEEADRKKAEEEKQLELQRIQKEAEEAEQLRLQAIKEEEERKAEIERQKQLEEAEQQKKIEEAKAKEERMKRALEEKTRMEAARKAVQQPSFQMEIPQFTAETLKLMQIEVTLPALLAIPHIIQNLDEIQEPLSKGLPVQLVSSQLTEQCLQNLVQLFKKLPECEFTNCENIQCQMCRQPGNPHLRQNLVNPLCQNCVKADDLNLQKALQQMEIAVFDSKNVKTAALMIAFQKAKELRRVCNLYVAQCDQVKQVVQTFAKTLNNTKFTLWECINQIESQEVLKISQQTAQMVDNFLSKCGEIKTYFAQNKQLKIGEAFNCNMQSQAPLNVYSLAVLVIFAHQDEHTECQDKCKTCSACQKAVTYKYSFSRFEKMIQGGKAAVAMCPKCLKVVHSYCVVDGICKICVEAEKAEQNEEEEDDE